MSDFEPEIFWHSLAHDIVIAGRTRVEGTWKCYIGSTEERRHEDAVPAILSHGTKVREPMARVIFPQLKELPYAR